MTFLFLLKMSRSPNMILGGPPIHQDYFNKIDDLSEEIIELSNRIDIKNEELTNIIDNLKLLSSQANDLFEQIKSLNNNKILAESQQKLVNAAVLYVSLLVGIISITLVWIFAVMGIYDWIIALALTFIILFFIFVLVIVYKAQTQQIINNELLRLNPELEQNIAQQTQKIAEVKSIINKKDCGCNNRK